MRKSLRLALTRPTSLYKGGCFPQKDGRRVRVSPNKFIYTKRKSTKEKSLCFFWRRRRDSTGFQPVVFALRTVYFMSLFAPQKDGRRVRVSPNKFIYTKRKSTKEKSLCFFWRRRRDSTGFQPVVFALRTVYFMSLFAPQKDGRRVRVSYPFCIIQKKGTGENPDTFFGAEGETRRAFNPSCSRCEQFILCPFLLRKKMDGEFESLQTNSYIQKEKAQRKNPCAFSGAEGETRTLAPVTRPTPLAGAPRHQLEYFCIGSVYDTIRLLKERAENPLPLLSGGESGIRTHGTLPYDGFQDRSVITTSVSLRIRRKL